MANKLRNPKSVPQISSQLCPILWQLNPCYTSTVVCCINFNFIFQFAPTSPSRIVFCFEASRLKLCMHLPSSQSVWTSRLSHTPKHLRRRKQVINLLIMWFSPPPQHLCFLTLLCSNSLSTFFSKHPCLTQHTLNSLLGARLNAVWLYSCTTPFLALILCGVEWETAGCTLKIV